MTRRERLMNTLLGRPVDRPAVSFYELNGLDENPADLDPLNIYSHRSWKPLIDLAREKTDRIVMRGLTFKSFTPDPLESLAVRRVEFRGGSRFTHKSIATPGRTLTACVRRDPDVNTEWTVEHLLKGPDDLRALLDFLPEPSLGGAPDTSAVLATEAALGDSGIVMIDTPDPLCLAAGLFDLGEFTVTAVTEPALFHRLLEWFAAALGPRVAAMAQAAPGRLWRIYGPEYAGPPYLRPEHFREYVVRYDTPMVTAIKRHGGIARIHAHGRLRDILDDLVSTGCDAIDPIEPPPQGDVTLKYVRQRYGEKLILFGNLEASDLENLPTDPFAAKVRQALQEGTAGSGRGFVLLPSACPYGRILPQRTLANYEKMIEIVEGW